MTVILIHWEGGSHDIEGALNTGVCFNQTHCLLAGASLISSNEGGGGESSLCSTASSFKSRTSFLTLDERTYKLRSAHVHAPHGWVERSCQVMAGRPPAYTLVCSSSPSLLPSLSAARPLTSSSTHLNVALSLQATIRVSSCLLSLSFFFFYIFLFSADVLFMVPVIFP